MKKANRFLSMLLSLCIVLGLVPSTAFAIDSNLPFTDVSATDWFYDAVQYVYDNDMMNGTSSTTFSPASTTTRGMIVTVLHRMEGAPAAAGTIFSDVPANDWCASAVAWASANNIVTGYGDGTFGPANAITREQLSAILYRYSQFKGYDTSAADSISGFSDAAQVSSFASDSMNWTVGNGLIAGVGNQTLLPKGNATRAQVATILMCYCKNIVPRQAEQEEVFTVVFDLNYNNNAQHSVKTVKAGELVSEPTNPARGGYSFSGWYTERAGGRRFDFSQEITSDLTLYAHWTSNTPGSSGHSGNSGGSSSSGNSGSSGETPAYILGNDTVYEPKEENLIYDEESGVTYYNNLLVAYLSAPVSNAQAKRLADGVNGTVVGDLAGAINLLQILVDASDLSTMEELAEKLMESDDVFFATYETAIEISPNALDLNPWSMPYDLGNYDEFEGRGMEDFPAGRDWGFEAIGAYTAWKSSDFCNPITVGILDTAVNINHEDLRGASFLSHYESNSPHEHGTSVAGIIAARNNTKGGRGIADTANLLCATATKDKIKKPTTEFSKVIKKMIESGVSVVNMSLGQNRYTKTVFEDESYLDDNISKLRKKFTSYDKYIDSCEKDAENSALRRALDIIDLLECGYGREKHDFLIVQSAGNGVMSRLSYTGENDRYEQIGTVAEINGYFASINRSIFEKANQNRNYSYDDVRDRIMIVGAVRREEEDGSYLLTDSSNFGASVDICAPGYDIYTTSVSDGTNNAYRCDFHGTSAAAPMVSGSAALLWSLAPDLSAREVKNILIENHRTNAIDKNGAQYPMLNIGYALSKIGLGSISGKLIDGKTGDPVDAEVIIYSHDKQKQTECPVIDGNFSIGLPAGKYDIIIKKDGYTINGFDTYTSTVTIGKDTMYLLGEIELNFEEKNTPEPIEPILDLTISGTAIDSTTEKPIEGVNVYLNCIFGEGGADAGATAVTAADGSFKLTAPDNATDVTGVQFEKEGYNSYLFPLIFTANSSVDIGKIKLVPISTSNEDAFAGGDGTKANPYQIATVEQLQNISSDLSANYILTANINCSQLSDWAPIGTEQNGFSGRFDGDGHSISNLTCSQGLFGYISQSGTVENVNLSNFEVSAGQCGGFIASHNNGVIQYCKISGSISGTSGQHLTNFVGGVAGDNAGTIQYCSVSTADDESMRGTTIGGIAGRNTGTIVSSISSCSISGKTESNGLSLVGGIVGYNYGGTVKFCKSTSDIVTSVVYAGCACGGIAGANAGTINTNYFNGRVYAHATTTNYGARVGGIVGSNGDRWLGKGGNVSQCVYELSENSSATGLDASDSNYCGTIENNYDSALSGAEIIDEIEVTLNF